VGLQFQVARHLQAAVDAAMTAHGGAAPAGDCGEAGSPENVLHHYRLGTTGPGFPCMLFEFCEGGDTFARLRRAAGVDPNPNGDTTTDAECHAICRDLRAG
jgi:hypothetical protein